MGKPMEVIVYDYSCQRSREVVALVNYRALGEDIEKRPEDYIFLLTPDEHSKYLELSRQLMEGMQGKPMNIDEETYVKQYPEVFTIVSSAVKPEVARRYKIADMTKHALVGNNRIVFFINRAHQEKERAGEILRRIVEFKTEVGRHAEQ
jgi:hypothetical protein